LNDCLYDQKANGFLFGAGASEPERYTQNLNNVLLRAKFIAHTRALTVCQNTI
jgi:hypothetical protein